MQVNQIATMHVETASAFEPICDLAERMESCQGFMAIINEDHEPMGVITDRDIVTQIAAERRDPASTCAGDVMSHPAIWIFEDADVTEAAGIMRQAHVRKVLVQDRAGRVAGVCTVEQIAHHDPVLAAQVTEGDDG